MENSLVSVIIPVYNVEKYLKRCIDSVLNQSYKNLEIIIIDDGSKDKSSEICDNYKIKDKRVFVVNTKNKGLSEARNKGIEISKGEYISFIDSDDWVESTYIEKLMDLLLEYKVDISICDFKKVYNEKIENKNYNYNEKIETYTNKEALDELFKSDAPKFGVSWGKIYKRYLFDNIRFPKGRYHEDDFTTYKLFDKSTKIVSTNEKLIYYFQRKDSIMGTSYKLDKRLDVVQAFNEQREYFHEKNYIKLKKLATVRLFYAYFDIPEEINKSLREEYMKIYQELPREEMDIKSRIKVKLMYHTPRLYLLLLKIKKTIKRERKCI